LGDELRAGRSGQLDSVLPIEELPAVGNQSTVAHERRVGHVEENGLSIALVVPVHVDVAARLVRDEVDDERLRDGGLRVPAKHDPRKLADVTFKQALSVAEHLDVEAGEANDEYPFIKCVGTMASLVRCVCT